MKTKEPRRTSEDEKLCPVFPQARGEQPDGEDSKSAEGELTEEEKRQLQEEQDRKNMAALMCSLKNKDDCLMCGS